MIRVTLGDQMNRPIVILLTALCCFGIASCSTMKNSTPSSQSASAPPPVYVVFFDGKTAELSAAGKDIVDHAAAAAKAEPGKTIQITGPSTKIVPGYNPELALPRMKSVEERLVADGIAKERFQQTSLPTAKLMVDLTGARRVEIRLVDKPTS